MITEVTRAAHHQAAAAAVVHAEETVPHLHAARADVQKAGAEAHHHLLLRAHAAAVKN